MTVPGVGAPRPTVPAIWGNVPQRNKNFTGRVGILERLQNPAASKVTAVLPEEPLPKALQGLGGVGKTAIAIEYAYRHTPDYELVWWIAADQVSQVRASLADLAGRLGLGAAANTGIDSAAAAALDALRRGDPYARWLLIFDNADQPEEIADLIPHGPGDVLITSRNHRWQSVIDTVAMNVFNRSESTEFLVKRVPRGLSEFDADRLAEQLGDLPLALEQAGAMLAETGMPVDEYLRLLAEQATGIMAEGKSPDYPMSMTAAWKLSVFSLRRQLPEAMELLRCCAFFGPEPIPRDVFRHGTQVAHTQIAQVISDPILLARTIRELGRFALLTIDGQSISVHRLIQALLRDELSPAERDAYRQEAQVILAAADPGNPDDDRLWPRYRELLPHVTSESTGLAHSRAATVRAFLLNVVRYLYLSGDLQSCLPLTERLIAQWTEDSGAEDEFVLDARLIRGNALRLSGQYPEAYRLTEAALSTTRRVLGESSRLSLALGTAFAADLRAHGDFPAALSLDRESLGLHERVFGGQAPETLRMLAALALDHGLNSHYPASRELYQRVVVLMSEIAPAVSRARLVGAWTGLASAVRLCGSYSEARDVGEEAWDFGVHWLGALHFATLRSSDALSIASRKIPSAQEKALEIARFNFAESARLFGARNPDTMASGINLFNLQRVMGDLDGALALAEEIVADYPGVYGPDHPYNYGCMGNLALLCRVTGDAARARELDEVALAGLDGRLTRDHHYPLIVATNLASDLAALDLSADARALGEETLPRMRALLGASHPDTLSCAANLALDLRANGQTRAGDALQADTVARYAATLGADHMDARDAAAGKRLDLDFDPRPI